jgi:3-phytase
MPVGAANVPATAFALLVLTACASGPPPVEVRPFAETDPVSTVRGEDAADDPAIWVHASDPEKSLVFGTDKKAGLYSYNLSGHQVQSLPAGLLNNVDVRQNLGGLDRMAASNRSDDTLALFAIEPSTGEARLLSLTPTGKVEPYGFCMGRTESGWRAAIPYKDGQVQFLDGDRADKVRVSPERWTFTSIMEGCVFDEDNQAVFVSEELVGLWRITHESGRETSRTLIDRVGSPTGLRGDVEGVAIWRGRDGDGYVVVSSQSADRYMVYDRKPPNAFRGSFRIVASMDGRVDGVTHTDGIDISSAPLGPNLPRGVFVAQDDSNTAPDAPQNFKFVDWREIETALKLEQR